MTQRRKKSQPKANSNPNSATAIKLPTSHAALIEYLKSEAAKLWDWFSSHQARSSSSEAVRLELLKSAYRLERPKLSDGKKVATDVYQLADAVAKKMKLSAPITIYQAQDSGGPNASLAWLPDGVHVVLHGSVLELLTHGEITALLAHEFAHHELYTIEDGAGLVLEQVLAAMISDPAADNAHERTWRTHRLHTELYCDRRAAEVTNNINDCVCALVKLETGQNNVSAKAYFLQADEVLADQTQKTKGSDGITHPEMFIRAKALQLWRDDPKTADAAISQLVEGQLQLQQLSLLRQRQMRKLTRVFLQSFLSTHWLQTDLMLGHAKRFFDDFEWSDTTETNSELKTQLVECDAELRNYFCYVLLDFVTYDADLEEAPLAAAFVFTEACGLIDEFRALAATELKFGKRALQKVETEAPQLVRQADSALAAS